MTNPVIYKAAHLRLGEIWDYTVEKWGEEQADTYLRALAAAIRSIPTCRHTWRSPREKRLPDVFFIKSGHHFIFFKEIPEKIAVISILHENMDMLSRLHEDAAGDA
jgi:toxin ParE1/3/4